MNGRIAKLGVLVAGCVLGVWLAPAWAVSQCGGVPPDLQCYNVTCNGTTLEWMPTTPKANGTACNDQSACTTPDKCDGSGTCVGTSLAAINDGNPCTTDSCVPATGVITHAPRTSGCCTAGTKLTNQCCSAGVELTSACNDGNACTTGDTCAAGLCKGGPAANACCTPQGTVRTDSCCSGGAPVALTAGQSCTYSCYDALGRTTRRTVCAFGQACSTACP